MSIRKIIILVLALIAIILGFLGYRWAKAEG
jgi:uncharacterized membrane protein YtjA (UPF0391 family)